LAFAALARDVGRAPEDERYDINREIFNEVVGDIRHTDFDELRDSLAELLAPDLTAKSTQLVSDRLLFETSPSAKRFELGESRGNRVHTSILEVNEYGIVMGHGDRSRWLEKTTSTFDFCKSFVAAVDVVKAIILTRQRQIAAFLRPERDQGPLGFRFRRADEEKLTDRDKLGVRRVEKFLLNSGDVSTRKERERLRRATLPEFAAKFLWDTLSSDACPIELTYTNSGRLSGYHNIDYSTIRLCTEHGYEGADEVRAVQVIDGVPYVVYGYDHILYPVRNPRSDLYAGGYGYGEPEMIIRAATAYLNAVTYNAAGLDRNAIPRGILTLFGKYGPRDLNNFKRQFRAMLTGAANRWTIPVMASNNKEAGHVYTPIDQNFDEMFFARWMIFLISIVCAIYGIDPNEVHFDSFSTRASSLSGKDTQEKLAMSRDKGLVPLLAFVERAFNEIVALVDPRYLFEFVGLHEENEQQKFQRIQLSSSWNELRAIDGREPSDDDLVGNAPAGNPAMMQVYMMSLGANPSAGDDEQPGRRARTTDRDERDVHKAVHAALRRGARPLRGQGRRPFAAVIEKAAA